MTAVVSGRSLEFEVTNQADTNTAGIEQLVPGMSTVQLFSPAKRWYHLSIRHPVAIPDHKVIADPQPGTTSTVFPSAVLRVDRFHTAGFRGRMMQYEILPT